MRRISLPQLYPRHGHLPILIMNMRGIQVPSSNERRAPVYLGFEVRISGQENV
jgi:hypothetical protein